MCSPTHELSNRNVDGFSHASHLALGASRKATGGPVARVAAGAFLNAIEGNPIYEQWYRRILNFTAARFIDRDKGVASTDHRRIAPECGAVFGKVDIYHTLQACLIPTLPTTGSVTHGLLETNST
jgi:hypothetical protein